MMEQFHSSKQFNKQIQPLRIVLIGLPYCGIQTVAKILHSDYKFVVFRAFKKDKPQEMSNKKYTRQQCFKEYKQTTKAVLITDIYQVSTFEELKKRNYVNVIQIQSSFKFRYESYLTANKLGNTLDSMKEFMKLDEQFQTTQFSKCLQFARVKLINNGSEQALVALIKQKQDEVIRYFRPSWDQYFMKMADIARRRSNCMKTSVGAVIVNDDNRVVSTGFNGTPKGIESCYKFGCERCNKNQGKQLDQCLCLHAEQSAIIQVGIGKTKGCRLYTTYYPCFSCAKVIKQAGIKKILYMDEYEKEDSGKPFIQQNFSPEDVIKIGADNLYY